MLSLTMRRVRNRLFDYVHTYRVRHHLLRKHGIARTREFHRPQWHLGARYYEAVLAVSGAHVFVKHGWPEMIANEVTAWQTIAAHGGAPFLADLVAFDLTAPFPFAAFERIAGDPLTDIVARGDVHVLGAVARQLLALIDVLDAAAVVHRDIRPENLLVRHGSAALVVIDFALAAVPGGRAVDQRLPDAALRTLGAGLNPAPLHWDDAHAAHAVLRQIEAACGMRLGETEQLRARIGRRTCCAVAA